jgi:hypothetical protein
MLPTATMSATTAVPDRRIRQRLRLMVAAMIVWAVGYLIVMLAQQNDAWWGPGLFISMALIPAFAVALALRRGSPRWLAAAVCLLASWAAILGVVGLASIGLPLLLVSFLTYRTIPACADGREGRPDRRWSRRALGASLVLGLAYALAAVVAVIVGSN